MPFCYILHYTRVYSTNVLYMSARERQSYTKNICVFLKKITASSVVVNRQFTSTDGTALDTKYCIFVLVYFMFEGSYTLFSQFCFFAYLRRCHMHFKAFHLNYVLAQISAIRTKNISTPYSCWICKEKNIYKIWNDSFFGYLALGQTFCKMEHINRPFFVLLLSLLFDEFVVQTKIKRKYFFSVYFFFFILFLGCDL